MHHPTWVTQEGMLPETEWASTSRTKTKASTENKCVGRYICKRSYFPCYVSRNTHCNKVYRNLGDLFDPFINSYYSDDHCFQQDNDPRHTSRSAQQHFEDKGIKWWRTPASSPDLNPIELVWGSLKQHLRTEVKPRTIEELKTGIRNFWGTLTPQVCQRYIGHLRKVIPRVIEEKGGPSGY